MGGDGSRRHWADDGELAEEIELYGELVVAASESEELTQREIDRVLGVDPKQVTPAGGSEARASADEGPE